jgi:hypothetical protein
MSLAWAVQMEGFASLLCWRRYFSSAAISCGRLWKTPLRRSDLLGSDQLGSHRVFLRFSLSLSLLALLLVVTAASLRLRRSRPPAQGCGRQTATLGPHPTKPFNPNGVASHAPFSHPSRPEPLCGSIVTPLIPRVGLIPFGRPWAGGPKPFGLGGRPPFRHLPRGGWGLGDLLGTDPPGSHRVFLRFS